MSTACQQTTTNYSRSLTGSRPTQQKTHNLFWPDENSIEQCCAAHIVQGCQQYCQHCYTCLQANSGSSTCSVLLTTLNNVGSTTLFSPVFIRPEQVVRFLLCTQILPTGSVVSTVALSSASRTSNKFTETVVRLRPTNTSDTPSQGGLIMVDKLSTLVERQSNTTSNCRYYDNIRCFQNGLGCFHGNPGVLPWEHLKRHFLLSSRS